MSNKSNRATSWSSQSRVMCSNWRNNKDSLGGGEEGRGASLRKADVWNLKTRSRLTVSRHLREKTQSSMLVVTLREGVE